MANPTGKNQYTSSRMYGTKDYSKSPVKVKDVYGKTSTVYGRQGTNLTTDKGNLHTSKVAKVLSRRK